MVKICCLLLQNIAVDDLASCENVLYSDTKTKAPLWMCVYHPYTQWKLKTSFSKRAYCFCLCFPETGLDRNPMCVVPAFPAL